MTDINLNFDYPIPDEQFIDDFKSSLNGTFNYQGPEELKVTVDSNGNPYTQQLDGPVYDGEITLTINVTTNPEMLAIASLLWGRDYNHVIETEDTTLDDGSVYAVPTNLTIHDYYHLPTYDLETNSFRDLELLVKDALSPTMRTKIAKGEMFIKILEGFELSAEDQVIFDTYKTALEDYTNKTAMPWKYANNNPFDLIAPKIPMALVTRVNEVKSSGI